MFKFLVSLLLISSAAHASVSVPNSKQYLRTVYNVAQSGGQSVAHPLGVKLPAGAIITNEWVYINTAFTDSGTGSFAIQCAGTRDLMDYNDITAYAMNSVLGRALTPTAEGPGSIIPQNAGAAADLSTFGSVPTACEVNAIVRGDPGFVPLTGGKATIIIEYFVL